VGSVSQPRNGGAVSEPDGRAGPRSPHALVVAAAGSQPKVLGNREICHRASEIWGIKRRDEFPTPGKFELPARIEISRLKMTDFGFQDFHLGREDV
jgi:hypothetical protein